jgi:hypothetical protein
MHLLSTVCRVQVHKIKKIIHMLQVLRPFETFLLHFVSVFWLLAQFNKLMIII